MKSPSGGRLYWLALALLAITALVTVDAVLLSLGSGYFGRGFGSTGDQSWITLLTYFLCAAVFDLWLVLTSWMLALPFLRRFGGGPLRAASLSLILATGPAIFAAIISYRVHRILGDIVSSRLLSGSTVGVSSSSARLLSDFLSRSDLIVATGIAVAMLLGPILAWRLDRSARASHIRIPSARALFTTSLLVLAIATAAWAYASTHEGLLRSGLHRKASLKSLTTLLQFATDWDRDGAGWLSRPGDPNSIDASIRPYAIEQPANGVDENGFGGDQPAGLPPAYKPLAMESAGSARPHFLLIFLESFRPEFIGTELDGRPLLPNLAALASRGSQSQRTFAHSPWTLASRRHLFMGDLLHDTSTPTLVDDFIRRGYFVAHFSGQDDSYGDSITALGFDRTNRFYDARVDIDRRTSRSTVPVSLQISWKTLTERTLDFLDHYDSDKPLYLYVNLVDTHFPYTHQEIDPLFPRAGIDRDAISADTADQVIRTYLNTAANVDVAVGQLLDAWDRRFGTQRNAILVLGDHAEAFYERGSLGHGQTIQAIESRIPLIAVGLGGDWEEPIGISEIRGKIARHLHTGDEVAPPRFVPSSKKKIFQYLGTIDEPERIAMRGFNETIVLDLIKGEGQRLGPNDELMPEPPTDAEINELVWGWERLQADREELRGTSEHAEPPH